MDKYTDLFNEVTNTFKKIHKDSQYIYPTRRGPIELSLVYDIRFNSSNTPHRRTASVEVSIFNTKSPAGTFDLIDRIEHHFTDGLVETDNFLVKFDRYAPITSQQRIDTSGLLRVDLTMDVTVYDKGTNYPDNIQRLN